MQDGLGDVSGAWAPGRSKGRASQGSGEDGLRAPAAKWREH
ncbi:hypothetical protein [Streptomyces pactum]|nr:hypothetical protein [Streptomyces pactum]